MITGHFGDKQGDTGEQQSHTAQSRRGDYASSTINPAQSGYSVKFIGILDTDGKNNKKININTVHISIFPWVVTSETVGKRRTNRKKSFKIHLN